MRQNITITRTTRTTHLLQRTFICNYHLELISLRQSYANSTLGKTRSRVLSHSESKATHHSYPYQLNHFPCFLFFFLVFSPFLSHLQALFVRRHYHSSLIKSAWKPLYVFLSVLCLVRIVHGLVFGFDRRLRGFDAKGHLASWAPTILLTSASCCLSITVFGE